MSAAAEEDRLRTLLLTPWMSPHRVIGWRKAICHVVMGEAEALESYELVCASPSIRLQIPAVLRLTREMRANKSGPKFSRPNVYQRDGHRCCYDGERHPVRELTYDHVIPRSRGGRTDYMNIVTACKACNFRKGNRTPTEAGMRMHFQPFVPRTLPMTGPILMPVEQMPALWLPYVRSLARTA